MIFLKLKKKKEQYFVLQPNRFLSLVCFKANSCLFFLKAVVFGCFLDWFSGKKFLIFLKVDVVGTMDQFFRNLDDGGGDDAFQNDQKHWRDLQYQKNYEIIQKDRYVQKCVCPLQRSLRYCLLETQ